jgi:DsbC/DsbD-like thiol-disulfide interchange protein
MGACGAATMVFCAIARAQGIVGLPPAQPKPHVMYAAEPAIVPANKTATVELRFRIDPGFHINSHHPSSDLLVPTELKLEPAAQVRVLRTEYPAGRPFRLAVGDGETLDVYEGEVRVRVELTAPAGDSTVYGSLHYQACDKAACYPPRSLPVSLAVTAR